MDTLSKERHKGISYTERKPKREEQKRMPWHRKGKEEADGGPDGHGDAHKRSIKKQKQSFKQKKMKSGKRGIKEKRGQAFEKEWRSGERRPATDWGAPCKVLTE